MIIVAVKIETKDLVAFGLCGFKSHLPHFLFPLKRSRIPFSRVFLFSPSADFLADSRKIA